MNCSKAMFSLVLLTCSSALSHGQIELRLLASQQQSKRALNATEIGSVDNNTSFTFGFTTNSPSVAAKVQESGNDDEDEWIIEATGSHDFIDRYLKYFGLYVERPFHLFNNTYIVKRLTINLSFGNDAGNAEDVNLTSNTSNTRSKRSPVALEEQILRGISSALVPSPVWSVERQFAKSRSPREFQPITQTVDDAAAFPPAARGDSLLQQLLSSTLPAATAEELLKPIPLKFTDLLNQGVVGDEVSADASIAKTPAFNPPAASGFVRNNTSISKNSNMSGGETANDSSVHDIVRSARNQLRLLLPNNEPKNFTADPAAPSDRKLELINNILDLIQQVQQQKQQQQTAAQPEISAAKRPGVPIRVQDADNSYFVNAVADNPNQGSAYTNAVRLHQAQQLEQIKSRISTDLRSAFTDPLWREQWYMVNGHSSVELRSMIERSLHPETARLQQALSEALHLNIPGAWAQGYTGRGVVVTVVDDGLDHRHSDLAANYDARASTDLVDKDDDPTPRNDPISNAPHPHGTRCGGEIAMIANNNKCGVGVAFNARLGGIRMLDGKVTDRIESEALGHALDYVDIFSSSWGPDDDGSTLEAPGRYVRKVLELAIKTGRNGLGTIYVWATGNGGANGDSCAGDGYASNVYTLGVGAVTEMGRFPKYGEACSATMGVTYSSGANNEGKIVSVDVGDKCTMSHTGTSAAAPLAAGIIALALEANPKLTWRDVQHLVVWTSDPRPITQFNPNTWGRNGVGLYVSNYYGFGLINADSMVRAAVRWTRVPEYHTCVQRVLLTKPLMMFNTRPLVVKISVDACKTTPTQQVNYVEHVQVRFSLDVKRRGTVSVEITSPSGTRTVLMPERPNDLSEKGFKKWALLSVHQWGENPQGVWIVKFSSSARTQRESLARLSSLELTILGTSEMPQHMKLLNITVMQDAIVKISGNSSATSNTTLVDAAILNPSVPLTAISRLADAVPGEPMVAALNLPPKNGTAEPIVALLAPPTTSGDELTPEQVDALAESDWSRV